MNNIRCADCGFCILRTHTDENPGAACTIISAELEDDDLWTEGDCRFYKEG